MGNKISLQSVLVASQFLHLALAQRTVAPRLLGSLVASYVNVLGREDVHHLLQHVLKEVVSSHAACAEVHLLVWLMRTREFGIGSHHLGRVARHLYLGNNRDATFGSVSHQLAQFVLGVVAAMSVGRTFHSVLGSVFAPLLPCAFWSPCSHTCQQRIALNLDAPARSIGEMEVQTIELVLRHNVNLLLDEADRLEVSRHVEHYRAPLVGRRVVDVASHNAMLGLELADGLPCVAESVG